MRRRSNIALKIVNTVLVSSAAARLAGCVSRAAKRPGRPVDAVHSLQSDSLPSGVSHPKERSRSTKVKAN